MYSLSNRESTMSKIGRYSWLIFASLIIETLIVVKFGWDIITIPIPRIAIICWSVFFAGLAVWTFWRFTYPLKEWPIIGPLLSSDKSKKE